MSTVEMLFFVLGIIASIGITIYLLAKVLSAIQTYSALKKDSKYAEENIDRLKLRIYALEDRHMKIDILNARKMDEEKRKKS